MIQKIKTIVAISIVLLSFGGFLLPLKAAATTQPQQSLTNADCAPLKVSQTPPLKGLACQKDPATCPGYSPSHKDVIDPKDDTKCIELGNACGQKTGICSDNSIIKDLNTIVGVLSGLVGVVVVGVIILGGIQYSMAGDKAEAVSAAKKRIINGVTALVAFLFIFAFLQWLIPGGIFS